MSSYRKCLLCKEVKDKDSQFTIESWKCDVCVKAAKSGAASAPPPAAHPPTAPPAAPLMGTSPMYGSAPNAQPAAAYRDPTGSQPAAQPSAPPVQPPAPPVQPPAPPVQPPAPPVQPPTPPQPTVQRGDGAVPPSAPSQWNPQGAGVGGGWGGAALPPAPKPSAATPTLALTPALTPAPGFVPPKCSQCAQPILGPALDAMQGKWHPDCFLCCICNAAIKEVDFAIVDGKQAHEACRPKPLCCKCSTPIGGMILTALNAKWHETCFRCIKCDVALAHQKFFIEEDDDGNEVPLCEACTPKPEPCSSCGLPVDRGIVALDATWHLQCFVCGTCKKPLDGPFFPKGKVPFCSKECYLSA